MKNRLFRNIFLFILAGLAISCSKSSDKVEPTIGGQGKNSESEQTLKVNPPAQVFNEINVVDFVRAPKEFRFQFNPEKSGKLAFTLAESSSIGCESQVSVKFILSRKSANKLQELGELNWNQEISLQGKVAYTVLAKLVADPKCLSFQIKFNAEYKFLDEVPGDPNPSEPGQANPPPLPILQPVPTKLVKKVELNVGSSETIRDVLVVDLNSDGRRDFITAGSGGMEISYNQGGGSFSRTYLPLGGYESHIIVKLGLLKTEKGYVLSGLSEGQWIFTYTSEDGKRWTLNELWSPGFGNNFYPARGTFSSGDFNGDGVPDFIAVKESCDGVSVCSRAYTSKAIGQYSVEESTRATIQKPEKRRYFDEVFQADLNSDGKSEALEFIQNDYDDGKSCVRISSELSGGGFIAKIRLKEYLYNPDLLLIEDFDKDGLAEIFYWLRTGRATIFYLGQ